MNKPTLILINLLMFVGIAACGPKPTSAKPLKAQETPLIKADLEQSDEGEGAVKIYEDSSVPDLANGRRQFSKCKVCHTLLKGERHKVGPNLYGILGRPAATSTGFRYSTALKKSDIVWNEKILDQWINNPRKAVPGTSMSFVGIRNEKSRRDLLAYVLRESASAD